MFRPGYDQRAVNDQITGKNQNLVPKKLRRVVLIRKKTVSLKEWRLMRLPEGARLIRFTNEEFTQLITYMSGQYRN